MFNWLKTFFSSNIPTLTLSRRYKITTGNVSDLYLDKNYVGVALDVLSDDEQELIVTKYFGLAKGEFDKKHNDATILVGSLDIEKNKDVYPELMKSIKTLRVRIKIVNNWIEGGR